MVMTSAEVQAKIDKLEVNMGRLDTIINGDNTSDTTVDSGTVPSISKFFKTVAIARPLTVAGGTANAITVTPPSEFIAGRIYSIVTPNSNTGATTITVTGYGTYNVLTPLGANITANTFYTNSLAVMVFNGTEFQILYGYSDFISLKNDAQNSAELSLQYANDGKDYIDTNLAIFESSIASKASIDSPTFTTAANGPTPPQFDNDTSLATTAFVQRALGNERSFNNINAATSLTSSDVGKYYMVTGSGAISINLPALSTVDSGSGLKIKNWSATVQTISANGTDMVSNSDFAGDATFSLDIGETAYLVASPDNNVWALTKIQSYGSGYLPLNGGGDIADTQTSFTGKIGTVKIDTNFDFTGGTVGYVQSPLRVNAQAQAGVTSYIWSITGVLDNYATAGENVAGYFQGNRRSTGPTWAMVGEAIDRTETTNPGTGLVALELDIRANGTDGAYQRIGTHYVATKFNNGGADMEVGNGIRFAAESGCKYVNGIYFEANTTYPFRVEGTGTSVISTAGSASYTRGIDLSQGAFTDSPLVIPNNTFIQGNNASGSAENLIGLRNDNVLQLGGANNYWTTVTGQVFLPNVDNYSACGWSDRRWNVIYAATGSINTSDLREKTDREKISGQVALDLLKAVAADDDGIITYRWINGGMEEIEVEETVLVQKTETVTTSETVIELDANGVPREVPKAITTEIAVFEELPVLDENDQPVLVTVPARHAVTKIDDHGVEIVVSEARDEYSYTKTYSKPVMVETKQKVKKYIQKEGVRKHAGWGAQVWKRELDNAGLDLGLLVMDDPSDHDSRLSLRPDQTTPFLHAAIVELSNTIETLKKEIDALKKA